MRRLRIVALALFISAIALSIFLMVGTYYAKIVQPASWTMETLLVATFLLISAGGFVSAISNTKKMKTEKQKERAR